jgi:hypothetical protein
MMMAAALIALGLARGAAQLPDAYADAVAAYRSGNRDAAFAVLAAMSDDDLQRISRVFPSIVRRGGNLDTGEAAAVLHTDFFLDASGRRLERAAAEHFGLAERLAHAICDAAGRRCEFLRQWYLLVAAHHQRQLDFNRARVYLAQAESRFRDDPEILLARGSLYELMAKRAVAYAPAAGRSDRLQPVDHAAHHRRAAEYFTRSLRSRPTMVEARLRLGRVRHELRELRGAERELETLLRADTTAVFRYLALVFLASVKEDLAQRGDAALLYKEAARLRPEGQTVFVGLAALYIADGQPAEAARSAEYLFAPRTREEPWWWYLQGESWHLEPRLERLRERVQK